MADGLVPVLAFDSDEPEFVRGFEMGRLWQMTEDDAGGVETPIHATNSEMAMRIAEARGLSFVAEDLDDTFVLVRLGEAADD